MCVVCVVCVSVCVCVCVCVVCVSVCVCVCVCDSRMSRARSEISYLHKTELEEDDTTRLLPTG